MTYLLCAGFGFSNDYWQNLLPFLDDEIVFFDEESRIDANKHYVGIGHSIGFQKLNNSGLVFDILVGLQGFLNFCGTKNNVRKFREGKLDHMIDDFQLNGLKLLDFFYKACGCSAPIPENVTTERLVADLESMKMSFPHSGYKTLIIGSDMDKIVPMSIINDNFSEISEVTIKQINGIGHSIGFQKAEEVACSVKNFICNENHY